MSVHENQVVSIMHKIVNFWFNYLQFKKLQKPMYYENWIEIELSEILYLKYKP